MTLNIEPVAASIFARHGVDFASARRATGWTNATWIAGGLALRLATQPGRDGIRREARLAELLPAETGYPRVLETGVTEGLEWSLAQAIAGVSLGEAWPGLDPDARIAALRQLWVRAEAVHRLSAEEVGDLAHRRAWFNSCDAGEAAASTNRLEQTGLFTAQQAGSLRDSLARFWQALPGAPVVLNHGDLTADNALWNDGQVVALLDFEFAVLAPVELDLNHLMKFAFRPGEEGNPRLRRAAAEIARSLASQPGGFDRLLGYAILLEQWLLELWLEHPEGEGPLEEWEPYRRLLSLADGRGGYLEEVRA